MTARVKGAVAAALTGLSLAIVAAPAAVAQTTAPILRVETGMHTTLIRRVVVDSARNRLITASDDKTIRVWQMPEARLLRILRVPIDAGHEGQLFGLAVSPDGKTVAAAGWTGWDWEGQASIYVFDVGTGDLIKRFGGLNDAVSALAWSPDGQYLAVGLQGRAGFRLLQAATGAVVASDPQYNDKLEDLDFSPQGRLVAVALDGMVRLYAPPDYRLIGRRIVPGGARPNSVRYSPDGELIAIGYVDVPAISVASGRDLSLLYQPATSTLTDQANFTSVVWSSDGQYLYAGGDYRGTGLNPLYRWPDRGHGQPERIPLMRNRISEIQQMRDGRIAFAAEDPGLGIVSAEGRVVAYRGPDIVNFSSARTEVYASADGSVITYPLTPDGPVRHTYSVFGGGDQLPTAQPGVPVFPPRLTAPGVAIANWKDSFTPTINGKTPKLDDYEMSRSYAIAPDGRSILLGTEWAVRRVDLAANEVWNQSLPAVAWSVNISQNGEIAIAALSDGTVRWYRMRDGKEIIAYFPHGGGQEWMAWTPDGYYTSSVNGDNFVGWHLNRGRDLAPDFYRAVQFDRILYRPDVVVDTFRTATVAGRAPADSVKDATFQIAQLRSIAPPRLKLLPPELEGLAQGRPRATLRVEGEKGALAIKDYAVFVNGVPITPSRDRKLSGNETDQFSRTVQIDLPAQSNEIRVEAFNGVSMGTAEAYVGLPSDVRVAPAEGNLYVLAIGVNAFPNLPSNLNLAFAAQDAEGMAAALERRGLGHYAKTFVRVLSDDGAVKPDREAILSALEFVQQGGPLDTVVIFLASHGITDTSGNYYFVPRDVARRDIIAAQRGEKAGDSLVSWTAFFEALRGAAGRRLLIVDTCHAGSAEGTFDSHSLMKRSASSLFPLIVASKGEEKSQEYLPAKHGLFTYALINALTPAADSDGDLLVSLREAFNFAIPLVEQLRDKAAGSQTPQMVVPQVLGDLALVGASR